MKVLITGSTGFIGSHLVDLLVQNGNHVYCVARDLKRTENLKSISLIDIIQGDLNDITTIKKLPKNVDVIVHSAALLGEWNIDKKKIYDSNVKMTELLLEWFALSNCKQFIFLSTPGVQGFGHKKAEENLQYNPRDIYEKTKAIAEEKIMNYNYNSSKTWTVIRPDFVYGPGDLRRIRLYKRIKNKLWVQIGKGNSVLRPTYVAEVCEAISMLLLNPSAYFQVFNVAGPELITSDQYIAIIAKKLGVKLLPIRINATLLMKIAKVMEYVAMITNTKPIITKGQVEFLTQDHGTDAEKINKIIGFSPKINFENGMRETIIWLKNNKLL